MTDYPTSAGSKEGTTSLEAAVAIERSGRARQLRSTVRAWFMAGNQGTADECAAALGETPFTIRPRVTELYKSGDLRRTGQRRRSDGGRKAHVMAKAVLL